MSKKITDLTDLSDYTIGISENLIVGLILTNKKDKETIKRRRTNNGSIYSICNNRYSVSLVFVLVFDTIWKEMAQG